MRLLAIKLDHIGDFALALPALKAAHSAGAEIDVVVSPWNLGWKDLVPWIRQWRLGGFTGYLQSTKTFQYRLEGLLALSELAISLPLAGYDAALDLRTEIDDWRGKFISWLSKAPIRVGSVGKGSLFLTAEHVPQMVKQEDRIWERVASVIKISTDLPDSIISVTRPESLTRPPRLLFHPGSNAIAKNWPLSHWTRLAQLLPDYLARETEIIVAGGNREKQEVDAIASALDSIPHAGMFPSSLKTFVELIASSDLLVALDSSPPHLARLVGTPTITLFSGTVSPSQWAAKGNNTVLQCPVACAPCGLPLCKQPVHECMDNLMPEQVLQTIIARLQIVRPQALR